MANHSKFVSNPIIECTKAFQVSRQRSAGINPKSILVETGRSISTKRSDVKTNEKWNEGTNPIREFT